MTNKRSRNRERTHSALEMAFDQLLNAGSKITAQAVADLVGVDRSLISNSYPEIHAKILRVSGKAPKFARSNLEDELKVSENLRKRWHTEAKDSQQKIIVLASNLLSLQIRIQELEALLSGVNTRKVIGRIERST